MNIFIKYIVAICLAFESCTFNDKTNSKDIKNTKIQYNKERYNLGNLYPNDSISFYVKYKNTGKHDLVINFAKGSCGCTAVDYSKEPLAPNQIDSIKVKFKAPNETGIQSKTIIIGANTEPSLSQVFFEANVLSKSN